MHLGGSSRWALHQPVLTFFPGSGKWRARRLVTCACGTIKGFVIVVNETVRTSLKKSQNSSWVEEQGCEWSQQELRDGGLVAS